MSTGIFILRLLPWLNYKVCFSGKLKASTNFPKRMGVKKKKNGCSRRNVQNLHPPLVLWKLTHHLKKNRSNMCSKIQSTSVVFDITYKNLITYRGKPYTSVLRSTVYFQEPIYLFIFSFLVVCIWTCVCLSVILPTDTARPNPLKLCYRSAGLRLMPSLPQSPSAEVIGIISAYNATVILS